MNAKQAKQLDFPNLLEKMGYHPVPNGIKKAGQEIWYKSPLANENTPSFHLTRGHQVAWVFKCFSTGAEGHILDFVIAHEGYPANDISSALVFLRDKFPGPLFEANREGSTTNQQAFSFDQSGQTAIPNPDQSSDRDLQFIEALPLRSKQVISYLQNIRKIPEHLAVQYLKLVRYKNLKNQKTYYAFGMKNRAGGYEIRAASDQYSFKSALVARDITVLDGIQDQSEVMVFEGMTDFLSFLVSTKSERPFCDTVILHSVNSYGRCIDFINERDYSRIHSFLDNDETGQKYAKRFSEDFGNRHLSHSAGFAPHKDVNAALMAGTYPRFKGLGIDELPPNRPELKR